MSQLIKTNDSRYVRDNYSNALLATDREALEKNLKQIKTTNELKAFSEDINIMKEQIKNLSTLKGDCTEIKNLLLGLTEKRDH